MPTTLVTYHYYEANEEYRTNLRYFLDHGYSPDLDFVIVVAGGTTVDLPQAPNIRYEFVRNAHFDFGGFSHVVNNVIRAGANSYDKYVFVNCSVRGPFLPSYWTQPWVDPFLDLLQGDVRLAGSTICIPTPGREWSDRFKAKHGWREPYSHVQTMAYAMDRAALQFLIDKGFYDQDMGRDKASAIVDYEILLSQLVIQNGWNISCLLPEYRQVDYRQPHGDINPNSGEGDPSFQGSYFGRSAHPFETLFVKTNRQVAPEALLSQLGSTQAALRHAGSAYRASPHAADLAAIANAWGAHRNFATWLTRRLPAPVVVDVGADNAYSTICMALAGAAQVFNLAPEGGANPDLTPAANQLATGARHFGLTNVALAAAAHACPKEVDIAQIEGQDPYETVKASYLRWKDALKPGGVVLLHGTRVLHHGARRLFDEIDLPKTNLANAHGLGVVSRDHRLVAEIAEVFATLIEPGSTSASVSPTLQ
jgi:hypothetical protein